MLDALLDTRLRWMVILCLSLLWPANESDAAVDDDVDSNDEDDGDASSPSDDEMSTWHSYPLSLVTKKGSSFGYESSHS